MPREQIPMQGRALPKEFSFGPLRFTNADSFPLDEVYFHYGKSDELTLRLSARFSADSPWRGDSMVVFFLYRFPDGLDAFRDEVERYREDEATGIKLPEEQPFGESVLKLDDLHENWQHDCFACSSRNVFHVYQSDDVGVMIRWFSQRGTMLDHPLLALVRDNVKLTLGQWEPESPSTVQVKPPPTVEIETGEPELVLNLDLRTEQRKIRSFIEERVHDYPKRDNFGPGEPGDPVRLITLGFYAEQSGYVSLVFDTRRDADVDGEWTGYIEDDLNIVAVPAWYGLYMAVCEEQTVTLTAHDGSQRTIVDNDISDEDLNAYFGEMLTALMLELRDNGTLAKLPLHPEAYMVIEEFDGRYGWPTYETRKIEGAIGGR